MATILVSVHNNVWWGHEMPYKCLSAFKAGLDHPLPEGHRPDTHAHYALTYSVSHSM